MAVAKGITQGTFGFAMINNAVITLRPGASMAYPINPDIPAPLNGYGGWGAMNYCQGLQFPQFNLPCIPLDTGVSGNWFTGSNLQTWFNSRGDRPVWDLPVMSSFYFSENGSVDDGQGTWFGNGVKAAGITISGRKGQGVAVMMRFAGTSADPVVNAGVLPVQGTTAPQLSFNRITFGGGSAFDGVGIVGFTMQYDTGLTPNMELDGTFSPVEQNGGTPSGSLTLEINALDDKPPPGWSPSSGQVELHNQSISILTYDSGGGGGQFLTITFSRLLIRDPRNRQGTAGRAMRSHTYDALAGAMAFPIYFS